MDAAIVQQVQTLLNYQFKNPLYLTEALTHSSCADDRLKSNERFEFLGDSVLSLVICQTLFERFPQYLEGDLTKIKSRLVSRKTCAQIANAMGLPDFVKVGKGMDLTRAMSGSIAAASLESMIAALYLDGGMEAARDFILNHFDTLIDEADAEQHQENFKSLLQQHCQKEFNATPIYQLMDEKGPDHNKCFEMAVVINHRRFPSAWGVTKKDAEQKAAYLVLVELGIIAREPEAM